MSASWFSISKSTLIDILRKLQTVFDTKADSSHTHTKSDITDFAHDHPLSIEAASTATSAINLDPNAIYKLTAGGKTFIFKTPADNDHYAWADITGKPSSYPPSSHTHTVSQITDFPSTMPPSSHTHGNIQNGGTLQTNDVAIANGDKLVITDSSDSSKIARASIAFDGSTATKCLTQKGTWENFTNNAGTVTSVKVGTTAYNPSSGVVSLPAYPTVNNGTLTLKRNNTSLGTFTANQSGNSDINFNVAVNETLTNQNLNSITTPGFYAAGGGNTCTNKPSGVDAFGLEVIHSASGNYYTQIIWSNTSAVPYRRNCNNGTWGSWALDKLTDTTYTFTNKGATLAWSTTSTIATVGGVDIKVTMPANPNTDHYAWSDITGKPSTFPPSAHTHVLSDSGINNMVFNNTDIPEGSGDLNTIATAHKITAYRNGFSIPYQMDNTNDGGIIRVRGTSESNCIFEFGTWDDSGAGETIQFNYYPTNSKDTPAHSVSVPKKTGTIALTSDIPTSLPASDVYAWAKASTKPAYTLDEVSDGSTRKLANYLPLAGGEVTGDIGIPLARSTIRHTGGTVPAAGTISSNAIDANTLHNYKTFIGSAVFANDGGKWGSVISVRHRNGNDDGNNYGFYIRCRLTESSGLIYRQQWGGTWQAERTIWDSSNLTNLNQLTNGPGYITGITKSMVTGALGYTPPTSDTNNAVTQTATDTDNVYYEVLFSGTDDNATRTEGARKSQRLTFNPYSASIKILNSKKLRCLSFQPDASNGTSAQCGAHLYLGNSTAKGTIGNRYGSLYLYSQQSYYANILTDSTYTDYRTFTLPDKSGTIALTSDIPTWASATLLWSDWANGKNTPGDITLSYSWGNYRLICFVYGSANNVKVMSIPANVLGAVFTNRPTYGLILEDWNGGWMDIVSTNTSNKLNIPRVSGGTATTFSLFAIYGL